MRAGSFSSRRAHADTTMVARFALPTYKSDGIDMI
jgi:hypothetical protein